MSGNESQWNQSQWNQSQWNQSQWNQSQWNQSQWNQSQWNQSQWNQSQWNPSQCHDGCTQSLPHDYIEITVTLLLLVVGICGNLLTITVMGTKYFRRIPVSVTLTALATSDLIFTLLFPFNKAFVRVALGVDIRSLSLAGCRAFFWFFRTSKMVSSWFVVLVAVERFVATAFPLKLKDVSSKPSNAACVGMITLCIGVYNGVWTSYTDMLVNGVCVPNTKPPGLEQLSGNFLIIGLSLYALIPATILLIVNPLTVRQLYLVKKRTQNLTISQGTVSYSNRKTTVMLVGLSVAFVVLVSPISLAHLLSFIWKHEIFESSHPAMGVFRDVAQVMEQLNYAINFLLYVLAGRKFRENVVKVIVTTCGGRRRNQVAPVSVLQSGQSWTNDGGGVIRGRPETHLTSQGNITEGGASRERHLTSHC